MMCVTNRIHYGRIRLFALYITSLSLSCRRIWRYWISKILSIECVSKIEAIPSVIFHAIKAAVCIQLTHFSYNVWEKIWTLSYHHHQIRSMTHLPLFWVRSRNISMPCMSFYIHLSICIKCICTHICTHACKERSMWERFEAVIGRERESEGRGKTKHQ